MSFRSWRRFFLGAILPQFFATQSAFSAGPALQIRIGQSGTVQINWANDPAAVLESISPLAVPGGWQPVSDQPSLDGGLLSITLRAGDTSRFFRLRTTAGLTTIIETSPVDGEGDVAVTRDTIMRLSSPLAANTILTSDHFYATSGGRKLLTRVELSSDRRTVTLFYLEPIPGSARVSVVLDASEIFDAQGKLLDADGDGAPGGVKRLIFDTLSITPVPQTAVVGRVFAAEQIRIGGNLTSVALEGVTVTVDGAEETLRAVTGTDGSFILQPAPSGAFFVQIDGRTEIGSHYPEGAYYPVVGKQWQAIPGSSNNLAGGTGEIFLPLIQPGTLQAVSATKETKITFPPSVISNNPALAGVSITVPPNALFSDYGTRGGRVGIAPVPPDRLPGPLPLGLQFPLVITIQTDGPQNFDIPVPVRFPNLPDPATGKILPPGGKSALWSFNHRTGHWEIQGSVTVSADGKYVDSDPGVGVRQPGWHGVAGGSGGNCDGGLSCVSFGGGGGSGPNGPDPCKLERQKEWSASLQCSVSLVLAIPGVGCAVSIAQGVIGSVIDCKIDPAGCKGAIASQGISSALGCIPWAGTAAGLAKCALDTALAHGDWVNCLRANGMPLRHEGMLSALAASDPSQIPHDLWAEQSSLAAAVADFYTIFFGSAKWTEVDPAEYSRWQAIIQAISDATQDTSDAGARISVGESATILQFAVPSDLTAADLTKLIDRLDRMKAGTLLDSELNLQALADAAQRLSAIAQELQQRGWQTTYDSATRGYDDLASGESHLAAQEDEARTRLYYRVTDLQSGFIQRGRLNVQGKFDTLVLAPNSMHLVEYLDPASLWTGRTVFKSGPNGSTTSIPRTTLNPSLSPDTDADGLPDEVEAILGIDAHNPDTNDDGIKDGPELLLGLNPLDGFFAQTGVIAAIGTASDALDIAVANDLIALADSGGGCLLMKIQTGQNPVFLSQVHPGGAKRVALAPNTLCVGDDVDGLLLYNISNPSQPQLITKLNVGGPISSLKTAGDRVYVATDTQIWLVDTSTGQVLDHRAYPGTIQDLALDGDNLYAVSLQGASQHTIFRMAVGEALAAPALTTAITTYSANSIRLTAGGGLVYVAGVAKLIPALEIIKDSGTALDSIGAPSASPAIYQCALNGSGLAAFAGAGTGGNTAKLGLLDVSNPTDTSRLLSRFDFDGAARSVAIYRGLAYVATSTGLKVVNYLPIDLKGVAPAISLSANFSLQSAQAEAGSRMRLTANVNDDVQVSHVQFYTNGTLAALVGGFPFDIHLPVPALGLGATNFTLRAKATDTGGNETWTEPITVAIVDTTPPAILGVAPSTNTIQLSGSVSTFTVSFFEALNAASISAGALAVIAAGPDALFGTADDILLTPTGVQSNSTNHSVVFTFATPLPRGLYRATLKPLITDLAGNHPTANAVFNFEVRDAVLWAHDTDGLWESLGNWSGGALPGENDLVMIDRPAGLYNITNNAGTPNLYRLTSKENLTLNGGTVSLLNDSSIDADLTLSGATLSTKTALAVSGDFAFLSGHLQGGGTNIASGSLQLGNVNGGNALLLASVTLVNSGTAVWHGSQSILMQDAAVNIVNETAGNFDILNDSSLAFSGFQAPYPQFINRGLLRKTSGTNITYFDKVSLNNNGDVRVETGTLQLNTAGGTHTGKFEIAADAGIIFYGGSHTLLPGSSLTATGQVTVMKGDVTVDGAYHSLGLTLVGPDPNGFDFFPVTLTVNGQATLEGPLTVLRNGTATFSGAASNITAPVVLDGGKLRVDNPVGSLALSSLLLTNGGVISGSADLVVTGPLQVANGVMSGAGRTVVQGEMTISGPLSLYNVSNPAGDLPRNIENHSNVVVTTTQPLQMGQANTFRNEPGALFDARVDSLIGGGAASSSAFLNRGTFRKSAGTGVTQVSALFNNSGTVEALSGTLNFIGGFVQTAGATILKTSAMQAYTFMDFHGGTFTGSGLLDAAFITNACSFATGAGIGQIKTSFSYTQTADGTLNLKIGGPAPVTGFDQLAVQTQAQLAGTLNLSLVAGYQPNLNDTFQIITAGSLNGTFTTVSGLAIATGEKFDITYTKTGVTLKVVAAP